MNETLDLLISLSLSTLRVSTPLIFAAMGGLMSERSGVINIALEGLMVAGAVSAAAVAHFTQSPWLAAGAALVVGALFAMIYGFSVIQMKTDQIVAGTAINFLAFGAAPLTTKALFDSTGHSPALEMNARFHFGPVIAAFVLVFAIHFWTRRTRTGLWHGFAGEHPEALSTAGISVRKVRWASVAASGAIAGLGGLTLSIFLSSSFSRGMTAGRGFMALAALIFGKWRPIPTLIACLFFGLTDALQIRLQGVTLFGSEPIPVQFIQILPYAVTLFVLAGFVGKSRAPSRLGTPWVLLLALGGGILGTSCDRKSVEVAQVSRPRSESEVNLILLRELLEVVPTAEPFSEPLYRSWAHVVSQGASLEGVYRGVVSSPSYRNVELHSVPASSAAVEAFSKAMAALQLKASAPWKFSPNAALPPEPAEKPDGNTEAISKPREWTEHLQALEARDSSSLERLYRITFKKSSLLTLKRVLGDAVLLAFERTQDPAALHRDLTLAWNVLITDLGSPSRKKAEGQFHFQWAQSASLDHLRWEGLNRAHRLLNEAEKRSVGDIRKGE